MNLILIFTLMKRVFDIYHAWKDCSDTFPRPFVRDLFGLRYPSEDLKEDLGECAFISHSCVSNSLLDAFNLIVLIDLIVNFWTWVTFFKQNYQNVAKCIFCTGNVLDVYLAFW